MKYSITALPEGTEVVISLKPNGNEIKKHNRIDVEVINTDTGCLSEFYL